MIFQRAMLLFTLFFTVFSVPIAAADTRTVAYTPSSTLKSLIKADKLNIVLFSDKRCMHCQPCINAFGVLTEVYEPTALNLAHLQLNDSNTHIFEQLHLSTLPKILAFNHSKRLEYEFECLGTSNKLYRQMYKWLMRLERDIQNWNQQQNYAHQIIVHCDSEIKPFWETVEQKELWLDLYCGNSTFLGENLAVIAEYGQVVEAWRLQNKNADQLHEKLRFLVKAYKYKFVLNWNVAIAQQIFSGNQSAFVLLINNQSLSQQIYTYYEQIKQNWYEKRQQHPIPILFAVTDLSQNTYETLRLKRYLTGINATSKKDYPYPILAFIEGGEQTQKYVMPNTPVKSRETVQNWIYSVYNTTVLKLNSSEPKPQPYLNEQVNQKATQAEDEATDSDHPYYYLKLQEEWRDLLAQNNTSPFFVYVTWRNSYQLQKLQHQVLEWWKSKEENRPNKSALQINLLQRIDLPSQLKVSYVPSVIFVGKDKQIRRLEGVTDLNKIKRFVAQLQDK